MSSPETGEEQYSSAAQWHTRGKEGPSKWKANSQSISLHSTKLGAGHTGLLGENQEEFIADLLLLQKPFLLHCIGIYFAHIDQASDLLRDTRYHKLYRHDPDRFASLMAEPSTRSYYTSPLQVLTLAIIGVTAQMNPTDVEAGLLTVPGEESEYRRFTQAQPIGRAAYEKACAKIECLSQGDLKKEQEWRATDLAAALLLRMYEKNAGMTTRCHNHLFLYAARLQAAGFHRFPRVTGLALAKPTWTAGKKVGAEEGKLNEELLVYRLFWSYFGKERVASWSTGAGYTIHAHHSNLCLRDPFGHSTIQELCRMDSVGDAAPRSSSSPQSDCSHCCRATGPTPPQLTAYAGAQARLGALLGIFYDRLGGLRSQYGPLPLAQCQAFAEDFIASLDDLENRIVKLSKEEPTTVLLQSQVQALTLDIESCRGDMNDKLCQAYASEVHRLGGSKEVAKGIMQRRKLDYAKWVIDRSVKMTMTALATDSASINRITLPQMVHDAVVQITEQLANCFEKCDWPSQGFSIDIRSLNEISDYIRRIFFGRDVLCLLARRNELPLVKNVMVSNLTEKIKKFFHSVQAPRGDLEHTLETTGTGRLWDIDEMTETFMHSVEFRRVAETPISLGSGCGAAQEGGPAADHASSPSTSSSSAAAALPLHTAAVQQSTLQSIAKADLSYPLTNKILTRIFSDLPGMEPLFPFYMRRES